MQLTNYCKGSFRTLWKEHFLKRKSCARVRLITILLLIAFLNVGTKIHAQTISFSGKNVPLEKVFTEVKKQTGYLFVYRDDWLKLASPVDIAVNNETVERTLEQCFKGQPLTYSIVDKTVVIRKRDDVKDKIKSLQISVKGKILNGNSEPLEGATVILKTINKVEISDKNGEFNFQDIPKGKYILEVVFIGYQNISLPITVDGKDILLNISLKQSVNALDQTVVIAYGTTTKRYNTGTVGKITSEEIAEQPVANPLAALEGRVPGLIVTQNNGIPGAAFKVEIRGNTSIALSSDPLFVIDGVPFAPNNTSINSLASGAGIGGQSPFSTINPADIESIEVLKDADATAIYGSRGANGVVLITTKKGSIGKPKFTASIYTGASSITRMMDMLNTRQYINMRKEAFKNDGVSPDNDNAYDLLLWDTTHYTDFRKLLIGGTAKTTDAQISYGGGNANTQFLIGSGYHRETTVFPGDFADTRASLHVSLNHSSDDHRFTLGFSGIYSSDNNNILVSDLTQSLKLVPNLPDLYDSAGNLNWQQKGYSFNNPLAYLLQKYKAQTDNLLANLQLSYRVLPGLQLKASLGYNTVHIDEVSLSPMKSQNPAYSPTGYSSLSNNQFKSWIIEPQIEYGINIGKGSIKLLGGGTFQENVTEGSYAYASGFTNDDLLQSLSAAGNIYTGNNYTQYKYQAVFARFTSNWDNKYILNLSGRRDGSSRFGPGRQFSNFGAATVAWLFSNEPFIKKTLPFISFGKLRSSYGTSGNDKIGDYKYLDSWTSLGYTYQNISGLVPTGLSNPNYSWELNKKLEAAIELGFIKDRILFSMAFYRNRSGNQLINYKLPTQTGFNSITENFPALVQNKGYELELTTRNIKTEQLSWTSSLTLTIPQNKLLAFNNIETSSYSNLVIGQPLSVVQGYRSAGVNAQTGVYQFYDKSNKPTYTPTYPDDLGLNLGNIDPKFYGGFKNSLQYKGWQLDIFFEYRKQTGYNYLNQFATNIPGTMINQPVAVLDRWVSEGDQSPIQKFTAMAGTQAYQAASIIDSYNSDAKLGDASFVRLKNLYLGYSLSKKWLQRVKLAACKIYLQAQNLLTLTNYKGSDPETQNFYTLPPLKTLTVGIQLNL